MGKVIDLQAEKVNRLRRQINAGMVDHSITTGAELLTKLCHEREASMSCHPAGGRHE